MNLSNLKNSFGPSLLPLEEIWTKNFTVILLYYVLITYLFDTGAFRLYDVDNDGYITRQEMYDIVDAIYQMVVRYYIDIPTRTTYTPYIT